ncbi:MAG TPA: hypothetical protein DEO84_11285, partial [candidate division Zixibacteria bacterium]|nr:hypothetical protein [candidate division Zixibacteria bacterium]
MRGGFRMPAKSAKPIKAKTAIDKAIGEDYVESLRGKIADRSASIAIIGMGYVGLPLAVEFGRVGFKVTGIDILDRKVKILNAGKSDVDDIKDFEVKELVNLKRLYTTNDFSHLKKADVAIICVPTPLNKTKDPDVSFILAAVEPIAKYLHKGMLIVLESTSYPGTTDELIREKLEATGLKLGVDFFLA